MIKIAIEGLVKKFGDTTALDGVSLRIESGELFFLLGPSGCGKTTLLRSIAGFNIPDSGRIFFDNEDVTRLPAHKRNTAMMFQNYALWPHMTVEGNVAFGLKERRISHADIQKRVREALESVHMREYAGRKISELSGGQQQRVALARALVVKPRCLLLDEPLSNLDARLRLEMRSAIRLACKENGLTAIYVTHDQKEALSISDRMAVLDAGRIVQIGNPEQVYRRPQSKLVAGFIGETNFIAGKLSGIDGGLAVVDTPCGRFEGVLGNPEWRPVHGEDVVLSVRPECWKLGNSASPVNSIPGKIRDCTYLGELAQYSFCSGNLHLKIFELNPAPSSQASGHELNACVQACDVVVLEP